jgi:sugar phosphate isomerase/epimerase
MEHANFDVSIRDQNVPVAAGGSLFDVMRGLSVRSVEALVDINDFLPFLRVPGGAGFSIHDDTSIGIVKQRLESEGVGISALLMASDFSADGWESQVDWATRVLHAARALGVPVVRIDPWTAKRTLPAATIQDNFIRGVTKVLEQTADTGVDLGLENHGHLFNDEKVLDEIFAAVPDPRLGMTLDTGNFYWWGYPRSEVYRLLGKYAVRTRHTHIKNIAYPTELADRQREIGYEYKQYCSPLGEGTLDLRRIVKILSDGGYRRDLCVEDESLFKFPEAQRVEVLRSDVDALRSAMK